MENCTGVASVILECYLFSPVQIVLSAKKVKCVVRFYPRRHKVISLQTSQAHLSPTTTTTMPSTATPQTPSVNALIADHATALLNAGISRSCRRRNLQDRVFRATSDVPCPALAERATPSPVNAPSAHDHTDCAMQESAQADTAVEALPKGC
eukprot:650057-Rhodomonas_salina.2